MMHKQLREQNCTALDRSHVHSSLGCCKGHKLSYHIRRKPYYFVYIYKHIHPPNLSKFLHGNQEFQKSMGPQFVETAIK